jgi:hypothetical protein
MTASMRSATRYCVMSFASFARRCATALITLLRGSPVVYTGWPKPMTISFAAMRRRISASASSGVR